MPPAGDILDGLSAIANRATGVAIAWHILIAAALVALMSGWRPSQRTARLLIGMPLASQSRRRDVQSSWRTPRRMAGQILTRDALKTGRGQGATVPGDRSLSSQQWTMVAAPLVLLVTMYIAFRWLTGHYGFPLGYLLAFSLYWGVWCVAVPVAVLGTRGVLGLFRPSQPQPAHFSIATQFALWWPLAVPLVFVFLPRIASTSAPVVVASVVLGVIIGITEEVLWRGVYVALFADNVWLNTIYPSLAFGLWHLCPLSVAPSRHPGGGVTFVGYAFVLGLSYAYAARRTRSIRWTTASHCIHDALGLGGLAYATWLT